MRRLRSMSRALAWVMNGRARAPPAWGWRIGVSTSTKSSATNCRRRAAMARIPDVEDLPAVGVGQQVDLPLAVPGVGRGQPVPLVGEGPQRLGQEPKIGDLDRELAPPAGDHLALGPDPVAQVGIGQDQLWPDRRGRLLHEQLHRSAHVLQGGEGKSAVAPDALEPTGHPNDLARSDVWPQAAMALMKIGGQRRPVEAVRIGIKSPVRPAHPASCDVRRSRHPGHGRPAPRRWGRTRQSRSCPLSRAGPDAWSSSGRTLLVILGKRVMVLSLAIHVDLITGWFRLTVASVPEVGDPVGGTA